MADVKVKRNLPIDIETDILLRLPVKTLVKFRFACKPWYSLISDPNFINMHRRFCRRVSNSNDNDDNLLIVKYGYGTEGKIAVTDTCSNVHSIFENPYPEYDYSFEVVGSCNGIVCVYGTRNVRIVDGKVCAVDGKVRAYGVIRIVDYISLWNPTSRFNKIILSPKCRRLAMSKGDVIRVGFGFQHQTNDYKVFLMTSFPPVVEIYSLSSDSWRQIDCADSDPWRRKYDILDEFGVYISDAPLIPNFYGAFCWLSNLYGINASPKIVAFDLRDEAFKEMMLPRFSTSKTPKLFNYKGSLALLDMWMTSFEHVATDCYVWVMKEYNDSKSWAKLCYIKAPCPPTVVSLVGIILETELVLRRWEAGRHVFDIDKFTTSRDIDILTDASYASSFTETLELLDAKNKL